MPSNELFYLGGCNLTPKEKRVALLLIYGKTRKEIAGVMGISENTVKTHSQSIFRKSGIKNQKALMAKYLINENYTETGDES